MRAGFRPDQARSEGEGGGQRQESQARGEEEGGSRSGGPEEEERRSEEEGGGRQEGPGEEGGRHAKGCQRPAEEGRRAAEEGRRPRSARPGEVDIRDEALVVGARCLRRNDRGAEGRPILNSSRVPWVRKPAPSPVLRLVESRRGIEVRVTV